MKDEENVQEEKVSEKTTSKEETKVEETKEETKEQPFSEEQEARMQQLIAQVTSTAKEDGKREMQGVKDREVAEANRRVKTAQNEAASYRVGFDGLDEDTRKDAELARYREQEKYHQSTAQEEARKQEEATYFQKMNTSLVDEVRNWGIDSDDKRVDYASDAPDYFIGRKRFTDSLRKIVGENQKQAEEKQGENFKNLESKLRKDLGLDSVDTTAGGGTGGDSDADFKRDWGSGSLPNTKVNMERARKLAQ